MHSNRKFERKALIHHLQVINREKDRLLGHLGNITTDGLLLFSTESMAVGNLYPLDIMLPTTLYGTNKISVNATCVWSRKDTNSDLFASGFRFENPDPQQTKVIATAIDALESRG